MSKRIMITETDAEYIKGLAEILMSEGALPIVFEVSDDYDVNGYEGLAPFESSNKSGNTSESLAIKFPEVAAWLEAYNGNFDFYLSLKSQFKTKGMLSEKQIQCIQRAIEKDKTSGVTQVNISAPKEFTLKAGTVVLVSKFLANKIAEQAGSVRSHRSFEILNVEHETEKAYRVTVRLSAKRTSHCGICGLVLENAKSIAAGIGPICAEKYGISFEANAIDQLNTTLIETKEVTTWIPKVSIKQRFEADNQAINNQVA